MLRLGVIGFGGRIANPVLTHLMAHGEHASLVAIADPRCETIRGELDAKGKGKGVRFYEDADAMLAAGGLDAVMVGTRCHLHAAMAQKVLRRGLPLFLEKPVATRVEDLQALHRCQQEMNGQVVVSFPLRFSPVLALAKALVDAGAIGEIGQVQAVNNVPYGGVYFHNWYRDESLTGGLWLQKATHDLDYLCHLVGAKPVSLCAMESKQYYRPRKPAGLKCADCDDRRICAESPFHENPYRRRHAGLGEHCAFGVEVGNHDNGSVLLRFENDVHVNYTQNFFSRNAGKRGARLIGTRGTLEFDFNSSEITVQHHQEPRVETHRIDRSVFPDNHYGGDPLLTRHFLDVAMGKVRSTAGLEDGLLSARLCLKAKESCERDAFVPLDEP